MTGVASAAAPVGDGSGSGIAGVQTFQELAADGDARRGLGLAVNERRKRLIDAWGWPASSLVPHCSVVRIAASTSTSGLDLCE